MTYSQLPLQNRNYKRGDKVKKTEGDYTFTGTVVVSFFKFSGQLRYVVEDERGLLLIMSPKQLVPDEG